MFEMLFQNAMRTQQTEAVAPMPRAQILEVPVDHLTYGYRSGKQNNTWPDPILPQTNRPQTPDQNHCHGSGAPEDIS